MCTAHMWSTAFRHRYHLHHSLNLSLTHDLPWEQEELLQFCSGEWFDDNPVKKFALFVYFLGKNIVSGEEVAANLRGPFLCDDDDDDDDMVLVDDVSRNNNEN